MLYSLFSLLQESGFPGVRLMNYITFRSGIAFVLALLLAIFVGRSVIHRLQKMQIGEIIRDLDLAGQMAKTGTPTMGGIIIIFSIIVPCLLMGNLSNVYMLLMLLTTVWLGLIGFLDDYLKLRKHNKDGMKGKYKIVGQVGIALIVGVTMYLNPSMTIVENREIVSEETNRVEEVVYEQETIKSPQTTIPFVKNNNFNYSWLTSWMGRHAETGGWIVFVLITIFLVSATSNVPTLIYSSYLNIMYVPGSEELVVYMAAFIGALIGFLWYNASPAQVFMGDTGSLTLGGVICVFAILIHKELLLPILCALFYIEDLSVILQVAYFKRTGGGRIFKMTPLHHHYQKDADPTMRVLINRPLRAIAEQKIVTRFWIVGIILAVITFVTLKIR